MARLTDAQRARVVEVLRDVKRTSKAIELLAADEIFLTPKTVRAFADVLGIEIDGEPAVRGRPPGAGDRRPRKARPSKAARVLEVADANPEWSLAQIGEAVGLTKQAVHQHMARAGRHRSVKN